MEELCGRNCKRSKSYRRPLQLAIVVETDMCKANNNERLQRLSMRTIELAEIVISKKLERAFWNSLRLSLKRKQKLYQ